LEFAGFKPPAFAFLRDLAAQQTKAWFEANKTVYERELKLPLGALIQSVARQLEDDGLPLTGDLKRSMFRINRDVRFSHDKTPYKTNVASVWFRPGDGKTGSGVLYFHLANDGCFMGAAFYRPDPDVLGSIRERIRMRPDSFLTVVQALERNGLTLDPEDSLSRMPRGFEDLAESPVAPFLRMKNLLVQRPLTRRQVGGPALAGLLASFAVEAMPLLQFGWRAVDEVAQGGYAPTRIPCGSKTCLYGYPPLGPTMTTKPSPPPGAQKFDPARASEYRAQSRIALAGYDACHELSACMLTAVLGAGVPAHVLVAGAGGGAQEIVTAGRLEPNWRFTAVDPSPPMMDITVVALEREGLLDRTMLHKGTVEDLPLDFQFDAATLIGVLHHLPGETAKRDILAALSARLKPGAPLILAGNRFAYSSQPLLLAAWGERWRMQGATEAEIRAKLGKILQGADPPASEGAVAELLEAAAFEPPTWFFSSLFWGACVARRR
jgi:tRNA (cmo5U34)-methyltransferase